MAQILTFSQNQEPRKENILDRLRHIWELFQSRDTFTKLSIVTMAVIALVVPIIIGQETGLFAHAGLSLFNTCQPIPSGLTQSQIQTLTQSGQVKWCNTSTTSFLQPIDTQDYLLGAYFYPAWHSPQTGLLNWNGMLTYYTNSTFDQKDVANREALLNQTAGNYSFAEENTSVLDYDIQWAVEHGIGYFVFDEYWTSPSTPPSQGGIGHETTQQYFGPANGMPGGYGAYNDGIHAFLNANNRNLMHFYLMLSSVPHYQDEASQIATYWAQTYFTQPNYMTINNKPVVEIGANIINQFGIDGAKTFLNTCRTVAQQNGFSGIYFIATMPYLDARYVWDAGFDGLTAYGYSSAGMTKTQYQAPYDDLVTGVASNATTYASADWQWVQLSHNYPFIPSVTSDVDERARYWLPINQQTMRTNATANSFLYQLLRAKQFVDHYPNATFNIGGLGQRKLINMYAWNEISEGGILMPTVGNDFNYLNSIRAVFGINGTDSHTETWISNGTMMTGTRSVNAFNILAQGTNITAGTAYHDSDPTWNNYQIIATINPTFLATTSANQHFGVDIWKNNATYLYVFVRPTGIYAREHTLNGFVGNEFSLKIFPAPLPLQGQTYSLEIDAWHGRVNVLWNGEFLPTINMQNLITKGIYSYFVPLQGGIAIENHGVLNPGIISLVIKNLDVSYSSSNNVSYSIPTTNALHTSSISSPTITLVPQQPNSQQTQIIQTQTIQNTPITNPNGTSKSQPTSFQQPIPSQWQKSVIPQPSETSTVNFQELSTSEQPSKPPSFFTSIITPMLSLNNIISKSTSSFFFHLLGK